MNVTEMQKQHIYMGAMFVGWEGGGGILIPTKFDNCSSFRVKFFFVVKIPFYVTNHKCGRSLRQALQPVFYERPELTCFG